MPPIGVEEPEVRVADAVPLDDASDAFLSSAFNFRGVGNLAGYC